MVLIRAVIFDMDGVLVDSECHWGLLEYEWLKIIIPSWSRQAHQKILGMSVQDIHSKFAKEYAEEFCVEWNEFKDKYNELAREIYENRTKTYPAMMRLLKCAGTQGFKTALCSSSPKSWIDIVMQRFGLRQYFDELISAQDVGGRGKPSPDVYIYAMKRLGVRGRDCLVFEDSKNGVAAAKVAGMFCVGFRNECNKHQDLSMADFVMPESQDDLEFSDLLEKL